MNALAAAATAYALEIPASKILEGLRAFEPAAMRMQVVRLPDGTVLINDAYNANPSSVRAAVASFCETYAGQPRWLVLGDMRELGSLAASEHRDIGKWLSTLDLQHIFLYGRDTRFVLDGLRSAGAKMPIDRFQKKRYLVDALQKSLTAQQPVIFFKASRSMKLEDVIAPLTTMDSSARLGAAAH